MMSVVLFLPNGRTETHTAYRLRFFRNRISIGKRYSNSRMWFGVDYWIESNLPYIVSEIGV